MTMLPRNGGMSNISEKCFKTRFCDIYSEIEKIKWPDTFTFRQKLYHFFNNDYELKLGFCANCGNSTDFVNLSTGYRKYCSKKCAQNSNNVKNKIRQTNLKKYGVDVVSKSEKVKEKIKKTNLEKYGTENVFASDEIKEKIKHTNLKKYGVENPMQSKIIKNKTNQTNLKKYGVEVTFASDKIKEKIKQTNLEKYGVENPMQNEFVKQKTKQTNLKKYGNTCVMGSVYGQEKIKNTLLQKYGVSHNSQLKCVKQQRTESSIKKYGVEHPTQSETVKNKIKETNIKKYGVEWYCMTKKCRVHSSNNSKPNREFAESLNNNNVIYKREFVLENYSYDFKINDILLEINPTITHNSYLNIFGNEPMKFDYHLNKTKCAKTHNYKCIHIWDWDNLSKIINMLKPKETLYARKLELKEVPEKECNEFLNSFHLQNTCKGQSIRIGLYKDDTLVQIMTLGKPRYNKNYKLELLRLCSHKDYKIVGGAEKIFKYILDKYKPKSIISYCDNSKFSGNVYEKLGFKLKNVSGPGKHWYNTKTKQHITDNLLRQRGFDQLFNTNYGKGTSNEELMIEYNFFPIYDCGQTIFIY